MENSEKDLLRLKNRYEILDKLVEATVHGEAFVKWADGTVVLIEKINLENIKITK